MPRATRPRWTAGLPEGVILSMHTTRRTAMTVDTRSDWTPMIDALLKALSGERSSSQGIRPTRRLDRFRTGSSTGVQP
jgi:hypothetical protein